MDETKYTSARDLFRIGKLDEASQAAEAEIERVSDFGNTAELWRARFVRADVLSTRGHVDAALTYLESLRPPKSTDVPSCVGLTTRRGSYSGALGRFAPAHQLLAEAERLARDADLVELLADVHLSQAFLSFLQKDYVSSDRLYRAVLGIAEQVGGWYHRACGLWGVGKNLMIQGHYPEAISWLEDSLRIFDAAGARLDVAMVWGELAVCHLGLGDDRGALELHRRAVRVENQAGHVHNYQVTLANIGNVYLHRCDYFTAIFYYQQALELAREIKDPVSVKKWTYNINLAYARIRAAVDQSHPRGQQHQPPAA
jgi:tetratricopeptide (TPR) repeat protein